MFWGRRLKCQLFRGRKVHRRQNPGYAYAVNAVSRLKFARLWKVHVCTQHRQMTRFSSAPLAQYCTSKQSEMWNQQHDLFCRLAIKETNFVLNCNSSFTVIFKSRRRHCKYDWLESVWILVWLAASTQSRKYDWLRLDKIWLAAAAWWRRLWRLVGWSITERTLTPLVCGAIRYANCGRGVSGRDAHKKLCGCAASLSL